MPANQIQSSNPETAPTSKSTVPTQPTTEQPSANSNPTTSNNSESNKPVAPTEQSKQLNSQYYKVNSQQVYVTNGQSVTQGGRLNASVSLNFPDTSKINNGDYIDIKLGPQLITVSTLTIPTPLQAIPPLKLMIIMINHLILVILPPLIRILNHPTTG